MKISREKSNILENFEKTYAFLNYTFVNVFVLCFDIFLPAVKIMHVILNILRIVFYLLLEEKHVCLWLFTCEIWAVNSCIFQCLKSFICHCFTFKIKFVNLINDFALKSKFFKF